ncbi:MAG: hypothetical protein JRH20_10700, partial [Deltaproteobacteria bacterium]|nr:hypothetical protein [Deltaproteobacteria bacterium]
MLSGRYSPALLLLLSLGVSCFGCRPPQASQASSQLTPPKKGSKLHLGSFGKRAPSPALGAMACASPPAAAYGHPHVLCTTYRRLSSFPLLERKGDVLGEVSAALASLKGHAFDDPTLPTRSATYQERIEKAQRAYESARVAQERVLEARMRLELRLADALAACAEPFERARLDALRWAKTVTSQPTSGGAASQLISPIPDVPAYLRQRLRRFVTGLHAGAKADRSIARQLRALEPQHPQYRRLLTALTRYRQFALQGPWSQVARTRRLRQGRRHRRILALKQRLTAEGYYQGPLDSQADEPLFVSVAAFKEAHQVFGRGLDRQFWRALRRPLKEKIAALVRELRRWRRSKTQASTTYVLVNIPSFHLELRKGARRLFREAVVVGRSRGTKCDEETEQKVLAFATPEFDARIEHLVVGPYWNVTKAIKEKELD